MSLRRYRMYGSASATTAAVDSMQVMRKGKLKQIILCCQFNNITDNGIATCEISRASTSGVAQAASGLSVLSQSLAQVSFMGNFVTSGLAQLESAHIFPCDDPVNIGELIYLHFVISGTVGAIVDVILVIDE